MIRQIIDIFFSLGLFINAALFIPQAIKLYRVKNSQGLSLVTFGGFNLIQLSILLHGYMTKDYLLVIGYALSLITCGAVTLLILLYRIKNVFNQRDGTRS